MKTLPTFLAGLLATAVYAGAATAATTNPPAATPAKPGLSPEAEAAARAALEKVYGTNAPANPLAVAQVTPPGVSPAPSNAVPRPSSAATPPAGSW
jgi:hypothetical protein